KCDILANMRKKLKKILPYFLFAGFAVVCLVCMGEDMRHYYYQELYAMAVFLVCFLLIMGAIEGSEK
ncbi:MAG: hypothetical protein U9M90_01270, partial [Patescibacteria group bacterium]|nr:hypothetical protein [Patescibacteria group bacterium]